jgi:hypothetical protein
MRWKGALGLLVVLVLTGLPVASAMCALQCDAAAQAGEPACHHAADHAASSRISAVSMHDCGDHDAALGEAWLQHQDVSHLASAAAAASATAPAAPMTEPPARASQATLPDHAPPDLPPPFAHALVLRI